MYGICLLNAAAVQYSCFETTAAAATVTSPQLPPSIHHCYRPLTAAAAVYAATAHPPLLLPGTQLPSTYRDATE